MEYINKQVFEAFEVIKNGGVILYPTDTVWGLGCDATNDEAVKKIFAIKQRDDHKSMICLLHNDRLLYQIFKNIPPVAFDIWDCAQRPTTIVLDQAQNVSPFILGENNSLGVRFIKEPFAFKLLERMKKPLVSTSANISGQETPKSFSEIVEEIKHKVDFIVDIDKEKICKNASTIIQLTLDAQVKILRK